MTKKSLLVLLSTFVLFNLWLAYWYSQEEQEAYEFAYQNRITTMPTIEQANMNGEIIRAEIAKMFANRVKSLWRTPDISKSCSFNDISSVKWDLYTAIIESCQLWIMWQWISDFRPFDKITRAEVATAISRIVWWNMYDWWNPYYLNHIVALMNGWVIDSSDNVFKNELRGSVMTMLMRASKNLLNNEKNQSNDTSKEESVSNETVKEESQIKDKEENKKDTILESNIVTVDWIEYTLNKVHVYNRIGQGQSKYNDFRKFPENDKWLMVEYTAKNTNEDDAYEWDFTLVSNWNQYDHSSSASVYWEYQLWDNKHSTKIKPNWKIETFQGFDVKEEDVGNWILYITARIWDQEVKVDLSKITVENHDN